MFDVGFPELVLIFVIALLVLGPQKLPKVAAEIGKWVGRARRTATQLRRQLEREIELSEIQPPPPRPKPPPEAEAPPKAETPEAAQPASHQAVSDGISEHAPPEPPSGHAADEPSPASEPVSDKTASS
jgi:sec-independent protein translocase protein TatB